MSTEEIKCNDDKKENSKLKLIIISKKGKLDKSNDKKVITLKNEEGRMELRMDNMSENITKKKIEKTLSSIFKNKSISDFKAKKQKFVIVDKKSNIFNNEREKFNFENNKNNDIYFKNKKLIIKEKIIEEKVKDIKKIEKDNMKNNFGNKETINNNFNNVINSNTYIDENSIKDDIVFVKGSQEENENNKKIENKDIYIDNNLIKNDEEIKVNCEKKSNIKEINTEPNNLFNQRNELRELIKIENITDNEEEEIEECDEDIVSYKGKNKNNNTNNKFSSFKDYDSIIAVKNDQSERDNNKYIISSVNEGLNNFNKFASNNISINTNINNNNFEKIRNSKKYSNKDFEKELNNEAEDIINGINKKDMINLESLRNLKDSKELAHRKNEFLNKNKKNNNRRDFNQESRKTFFYTPFNSNTNFQTTPIYRKCKICENTYPSIRTFVSECGIHFICKKCAKNYFEEQIENGQTELRCPFLYCKKIFDKNIAKTFLSEEHYDLLEKNNKNKMISEKTKNNIIYEKMQLYSEKNVIDINNNKLLFKFNKCKEIFCSNCKKDALFSKASNYFMKCLNCEHCQCRYCFKDIQNGHFDINEFNHCKVLYRIKDNNKFQAYPLYFLYLMQLFFVFAIFFMIFISVFLNTKKIFENMFGISKKDKIYCSYYIKMISIIIFSTIILLIIFPFVFIFYPFFPSILALTDF